MSLLITIVVTVLIFSALVLLHEFGHFWAAKRQRIKVLEFGIGFPPKLFGKKIGDTVYSINLIPFGGFVKMYGEDSYDPRVTKHAYSYPAKSPWQRAKVAFAGVFLNFLFAWLLLAGGFTFGMEPLISDFDDVMTNINTGTIDVESGVFIKEVAKDSIAYKAGILAGDKLVSIDSSELFSYEQLEPVLSGTEIPFTLTVFRDGEVFDVEISGGKASEIGILLHPNVFLSRLTVVDAGTGLKKGDVILSINDKQIFDVEEYNSVLKDDYDYNFVILRGNEKMSFDVASMNDERVYIDGIFPGSQAESAGFKKGDILIAVSGKAVMSPETAREAILAGNGKEVVYKIKRDGRLVDISAKTDETGILGVALSPILNYEDNELTLAQSTVLSSVTNIKKLRYPIHQAAYQALIEGVKLSKLTAIMFADTLRSIVGNLEVSDSVGGPVRIASITGTMIKEGAMALIRFVALLSLSLGVINLFPLPALDGGRLLFIFVEMVRGKPIDPRWESFIHLFGFIFLLLVIFVITYHDIVRLITG